MKTYITAVLLLSAVISLQPASAQQTGNIVTNQLLTAFSPRNFTDIPVTDQQVDMILRCGIKSPSSRNKQPWRFTVVHDLPTMKEIIGNVNEGNVLIIVSGLVAGDGTTPDFDCGLATQNMFVAATSMGLGARIYGGPAAVANEKRELLQVPEGYKVIVILRVGNIKGDIDAVSSASTRNAPEDVVNYKK